VHPIRLSFSGSMVNRGSEYVVLLTVPGEHVLEFIVDHASAVAIAKTVGLPLPDLGVQRPFGSELIPWSAAGAKQVSDETDETLGSQTGAVWAVTWEYRSLKKSTLNISGLIEDLNRVGAQGWELDNFDTADRTLGTNAYVALLRRPTGRVRIV
jgi:hypothetical protein